jgi:hypothetical protein
LVLQSGLRWRLLAFRLAGYLIITRRSAKSAVTGYLKEQLAGLAFCQVQGGAGLYRARAAAWHNLVLRMGVALPLYWVHDLGLLLATPRGELRLGAPPPPGLAGTSAAALLPRYKALLAALQQAAPVEATAALRLRDELVAALVLRTSGELARRLETPLPAAIDLPLQPALYAGPELGPPPAADSHAAAWLQLVTREPGPLHLQTAVELIDPETLRLLSLGAGGAELLSAGSSAGSVSLLDLLAVLEAPETRDIVRFSLELLPTVLEARTAAGAHSYPTGGYAALQSRGSLDALVLSELASDEEILYTRYALGDLLYYGREQQRPPQRRLHYVLVDASPSMRGLRQVFARGLALSLCKRLALLGGEVVVRFFDARLQEAVRVQRDANRLLPYLLGFRSQRGRNYGRVFADLASELLALRRSTTGPRPLVTVYLLTHGECHIPLEVVRTLRRQATLYGVFTLPSGELQLEYLQLLHRYQIVLEDALSSTTARRARALSIVSDATADAGGQPAAPR